MFYATNGFYSTMNNYLMYGIKKEIVKNCWQECVFLLKVKIRSLCFARKPYTYTRITPWRAGLLKVTITLVSETRLREETHLQYGTGSSLILLLKTRHPLPCDTKVVILVYCISQLETFPFHSLTIRTGNVPRGRTWEMSLMNVTRIHMNTDTKCI